MRQSSHRLRKTPEAAAPGPAQAPARASPKSSETRAIPLELKPLISPYREHGRFTLRIEKLPQLARLSAGQNNGDQTWSLAQDELEGLFYFAPEGFDKEHTLTIRVIAKDETGASTIALIDYRVPGADGHEDATPPPALRVRRGTEPADKPQDDALREQILLLKAALAERDAQLDRMRESGEQANTSWQQKLDEFLIAAESAWKSDEASRLNRLKASLQEEFEHKLADIQQRAQADADIAGKWEAVVFRRLQRELADAKDALASQESERTQLQDQLERLRRQSVELSAAKAAADAAWAERLQAAQAEWRQDAAKTLTDVTARWESAQSALARAAETRAKWESESTHWQAERTRLQDQLERLRRESEAELSAAEQAAEGRSAERLQAARAQWRRDAARELAMVTARCESAEAALVSARTAGAGTDGDAERIHLQDQLARVLRESQAELSAAKETAEARSAELLRDAQVQWQRDAARAVAEVTARCELAEAALARRAADAQAGRDTERDQFQDQLDRLRRESEAQLSAAKEAAEHRAAEKLRAAEAEWREQAARPLVELTARCQAAETALAAARAAGASKPDGDAYVRSLNLEIKSLQGALVDREADLARAHVSVEQMRLGITAAAPAAHWQPLPSLGMRDTTERQKPDNHLVRDVLAVFVVVVVAVLSLPRIETLLPDDLRAQIATVGGLFDSTGQATATPAPPPPPPPPKPEHPVTTVARAVNMRAEPAVGAAVIASLKRGAEVAILEHSGNWDRIQTSSADGKVQEGWVFGSYLGGPAQAKPAIAASVPQAKAANEAAAAPATPASEAVTTQAQPAGEAAAPATPASEAVTTQAQSAGEGTAAPATPENDAAAQKP